MVSGVLLSADHVLTMKVGGGELDSDCGKPRGFWKAAMSATGCQSLGKQKGKSGGGGGHDSTGGGGET